MEELKIFVYCTLFVEFKVLLVPPQKKRTLFTFLVFRTELKNIINVKVLKRN
jgi:hypothetical protein